MDFTVRQTVMKRRTRLDQGVIQLLSHAGFIQVSKQRQHVQRAISRGIVSEIVIDQLTLIRPVIRSGQQASIIRGIGINIVSDLTGQIDVRPRIKPVVQTGKRFEISGYRSGFFVGHLRVQLHTEGVDQTIRGPLGAGRAQASDDFLYLIEPGHGQRRADQLHRHQ